MRRLGRCQPRVAGENGSDVGSDGDAGTALARSGAAPVWLAGHGAATSETFAIRMRAIAAILTGSSEPPTWGKPHPPAGTDSSVDLAGGRLPRLEHRHGVHESGG